MTKRTPGNGTARDDAPLRYLRESVDALPDAFAVYDAADRLLLCNERYREIYRAVGVDMVPGAHFADLMRRSVEGGLVPDAAADPEGWMRRRVAERRNPPPAYESRRGDRWLQIIDRRLPDGGLVSIRRDITEQVRAEHSAGAAQQQLSLSLSAISQGIAIFDGDRHLTFCNARYAELQDAVPADLVGLTAEQVLRRMMERDWLDGIGDDAEAYVHQHLVARGGPSHTVSFRLRDGRQIEAEGHLLATGGLVVVATDVTDTRLREAALRDSRDLIQFVIDANPSLILYADLDRVCRFANATALRWLGAGRHPVLHADIRELLRPADVEKVAPYSARAAAGEIVSLETQLHFPDGITRDVDMKYVPDRCPEGHVRGIVMVATDITERKRLQAEARQREIALRDSERRFREFAETAADWLWETDAEGRYIYASQAAVSVTGHPPEWYYGKRRSEFYKNEMQGMAELEAIMGRRETFRNHVLAGVSDEGRAFVVRLSGLPVYDEDGTFRGYRGTGTEITREVMAEQRVRESERRFREFAEASADWLWETDAEDRFVYASQAMERISGRPPEWYYGKRRRDFYAGDRITGLSELEAIVARREPFRNHVVAGQTQKGRPVSMRLSGVPYFDEDGTFRGYRGSGTEITEQVMAEQRVREGRDQLQLVIDAIPSLIVYVDADLICRFANRTALHWLARERNQVLGRPISEVRGEAEITTLSPYHERALAGEAVRHEDRLPYPDGVVRDVDISYHPDRDPAGRVRGFIVVSTDVTERRSVAADAARADERLRQAQKMQTIGQLTGGIAHDFNNLLTAITGNLSLLQRRLHDDPVGLSMLGTAMRGAQRGTELVSRLLAASRRQRLQPASIDLGRLLRRTAALLQRTLPQNIAIEVDSETGLPPALVDPAHLEDALLNLAINARDAMPDGGRLRLRARAASVAPAASAALGDIAPGAYCVICVEDTGKGMAEDVLLHAFEPFFTTKGVGHGTGLGLSQVRGFVEQSGGHIRIDSRLGAGTAVELWLARAAEAPAEPPEAASAPPTAGAGETVLVVEDDPDVRAFVTRSLRALDYRVLQAGDGPSALRLAEAEPIDLLFTDLMLPGGLEGPALAEAVLRCRPGVPVLFTSGYPERFPADQLNHPVLPKPFSTVELSLAIRRALAPAGAEPVA